MENAPIKAVVLSVSDTRREGDDLSGVTLVGLLLANGVEVHEKIMVSDDLEDLRITLLALTERDDLNLIVTTGGTGFASRDNAPEATRAVIEKEAQGMAEAMRRETSKDTPFAMLSRAVCGIRGDKLIINLPGSPKAVQECFEVIRPVLSHAINQLSGKREH